MKIILIVLLVTCFLGIEAHLSNDFNQTKAYILSKFKLVTDEAQVDLKYEIQEVQYKSDDLKSMGGDFEKCAKRFKVNISNMQKLFPNEINSCREKPEKQLNKYQTEIEGDVRQIQGLIENLTHADIDSCIYFNPNTTANCFTDKLQLQYYIKEIEKIVDNIRHSGGINPEGLVDEVRNCSSKVVSKVTDADSKLNSCF